MIRILLFSIFVALAAPVLALDEVIRLTNGEWPPYTSEKLKHGGVFTHIVTEALAISGIGVEYKYLPWKRGYKLAKDGEYDGALAWASTPERREDFFFSAPVTFNKKVFFHLKDYPFDWNTIDDLKGLSVGATDKYTYGPDFDEAARTGKISVQIVNRDVQNIRKLMAGRIQIFPMEIEVGYNLIHQELIPEQAALITNHSLPVQKTPVSVAVSRKIELKRAQKLLNALQSGLQILRDSGRYDEMIWDSRKGEYIQ